MQAILDYFAALTEPRRADVVLVASDRVGSGALERARVHGIPWIALDANGRSTDMLALVRAHGIDYIILAGYLRLIPADVTDAFAGHILNIHPALLPSFGGPGMFGRRVHEAVLKAGVRVTGATAHFVDAAYDHGPVVAQWPVPVFSDDTPESLAQRVLEVEHVMYPRVVHAVTSGAVTLGADGRVHGRVAHHPPPHFALSHVPDAARATLSLLGAGS